jgi:hypothetical protein
MARRTVHTCDACQVETYAALPAYRIQVQSGIPASYKQEYGETVDLCEGCKEKILSFLKDTFKHYKRPPAPPRSGTVTAGQ